MPICERDPWRFQYFEKVDCPADVNVPTDDIDSWEWYPQWRWVYDKLTIARSQGLDCGTHDELPHVFPVFSKPTINLKGMGLESRVIHNAEEFEQHSRPGQMWMTLLSGTHVSTDCAVVAGKCRWMRHAIGAPWREGMFRHWTIVSDVEASLATYLKSWIARHMAGYTGMLNFETIDGRIIEAHLRFADQWVDLYGSGWIEALVELYAKGSWNFPSGRRRTGYSVPLFARHGPVPRHPTAQDQAAIRAMPGVSSLQITFHEGRADRDHPMPPGGFRLGIVNCWSLAAGFAARTRLAQCFPDCQIIIPD